MFLIPSIKVYNRKYSKSGQSVASAIHNFLNGNYDGYTCASGNIYGYYTSETTEYDELREFRVSIRGGTHPDKFDPLDGKPCPLSRLAKFLSELAADIDEECIYLESGNEAFLVYP